MGRACLGQCHLGWSKRTNKVCTNGRDGEVSHLLTGNRHSLYYMMPLSVIIIELMRKYSRMFEFTIETRSCISVSRSLHTAQRGSDHPRSKGCWKGGLWPNHLESSKSIGGDRVVSNLQTGINLYPK